MHSTVGNDIGHLTDQPEGTQVQPQTHRHNKVTFGQESSCQPSRCTGTCLYTVDSSAIQGKAECHFLETCTVTCA